MERILERKGAYSHGDDFNIVFRFPEKDVSIFRVFTIQDPDTGFWTAYSEDIPGLVTEAETYEALLPRMVDAAEECIELNNVPHERKIELIPIKLSQKEAENVGLL